jgi:hypothetical protein
MSYLGEIMRELEKITSKYSQSKDAAAFTAWIASCLTQVEETAMMCSFENRLVTYLTGPEIFNVLVIGIDGRPKSERTIQLQPYITKNYSCNSLKELHGVITCTAYELCNIVQEIENEITKTRSY